VPIAGQAWVWRSAPTVLGDKVVYDTGLELSFIVDQIERDVQLGSYPAGIIDCLGCATTVLPLSPETHHYANNLVALFHEKGGSD
jgi:hypothetical protein